VNADHYCVLGMHRLGRGGNGNRFADQCRRNEQPNYGLVPESHEIEDVQNEQTLEASRGDEVASNDWADGGAFLRRSKAFKRRDHRGRKEERGEQDIDVGKRDLYFCRRCFFAFGFCFLPAFFFGAFATTIAYDC